MTLTIDINCDMGEGFGRWQMPADAELMTMVSTVNVAAGFHAGDPSTMRSTVDRAAGLGLDIGAHVAFPDLVGFGRRRMDLRPEEVYDICLYQIGAVAAFVHAAGARMTHVKPHGALYAMASADTELALAVARACAAVDPEMRLFLLDNRFAAVIQGRFGVAVEPEGFPDLPYSPTGELILERTKAAWSPELVAKRAVSIVRDQIVEAVDGSAVSIHTRTVCLHSDAPNAVAIASAVRAAFTAHDIGVAALSRFDRTPSTQGVHA